ncbi:MAG: response regulator [Planctomycetes bacterium]|nr:response regulator [Planctomycetota bacterium]
MLTGKILVIDDEEVVRLLLDKTLRSWAFGTEALAAFRPNTFDIALVDLRMPGIDGI